MADQDTMLAAHSNTTIKNGSSTSSVSLNFNLQLKPDKSGLAATSDVPPPTAPRSMRRDISPPPLRRSDSYRPSEPQDRRGHFDSYSPAPSRHSDHLHSENRYPSYDRYRPYTRQENGDVDNKRDPKYSSRGYDIDATETRASGPRRSLCRSKDSWEDKSRSVTNQQNRMQPSTWGLRTYSDKTGGSVSQPASAIQIQEMEKQIAPRDPEADVEGDDGHSGDFQNALKAGATGLASGKHSSSRDSSALPWSHASTPRIIIPQLPQSPPYSPQLSSPYDSDDHQQSMCSATVDKEPMIEAPDKGSWVKTDKVEDFVCGRCLRKKREAASSHHSGVPKILSDVRTIEDNPVPVNATQPPTNRTPATTRWAGSENNRSCITKNMTDGRDMLHAHQQVQSSPAGAVKAANSVTTDSAMQGTRYKRITCPRWQFGGCFFAEAHCEFAHRDTGHSAPFGNRPAKDFTCPRWMSESCQKTETDCLYAHANTGIYVGPDHKASKKHITCYYWYTGHCRLAEEVCLYAHEHTGIIAWLPAKEAQARPGEYSLKSYTCPRWEADLQCKWVNKTCPYAHWPGGKSCLNMDEPSESRQNTSQLRGSESAHDAPKTPPPASIPIWAKSARRSPITIRSAIPLTDLLSQISTKEMDQGVSPSFNSLVGHRRKLPSEPLNLNVDAEPAATDLPVKHKAKRSNLDPRKRKMASMMSSRVPIPALTSPAAMSPTTNQSIPAGRKTCEICQKPIFDASRCVKCSGDTTESKEATPSDEVNVSMTQTNMSSPHEEGVPLEVLNDDLQISLQRPPNDTLLREALVANRLKRSAPEDNLFFSKRRKLSLSALEQVKDAAAGPCMSGTGVSTGERRQSLEELTRQALIEKEKSIERQQSRRQVELAEQTKTATKALQETSLLCPSGPPSLTTPSRNNDIDPLWDDSARTTGRSRTNAEPSYSKFSKNEHEVFSFTYAQYPSNFEKIAQFFPRRTVQDCIEHYRITTHRDGSGALLHDRSPQTSTSAIHTQTTLGPNNVRPTAQHLSEQSVPVTAGGGSQNLPTMLTPNANPIVLLPNGLPKRCCNCSRGHKRCFHAMNGNLDWEKCSRFLREHNNQYPGKNKVARREWNMIVRVVHSALSDEHVSQNADAPLNQDEDVEHGTSADVEHGTSADVELMNVDEPVSQSADTSDNQDDDIGYDTSTNVELTDLDEFGDEEGDSEDDIPLLQVRQLHTRGQSGTAQHSATTSAEHGDARQISGLTAVDETRKSDRWRASTGFRSLFGKSISSEGPSNGLLSPFQPPTAGPGRQRQLSTTDKEKAIRKLQARGVVFESDSDEEINDDPVNELPSRRIDPLWQPQQSMDLLEIDRWRSQTFEHRSYASSTLQPSKKQITGNLLKYQCRDRRRKFGNPHQEISRHVPDVEVRAWVQRNLQEEPLEVPELVEEERMMTFRQFIGIPEMPVIVQGKNKDELAFMEGKSDQEKTRYGTGIAGSRGRRKKEEDKFPFVYYR
ncbi:hypothetical protein LTR99_002141 [Exophiala xenobiotica]|nr:hypothetical protein LTR96_002376 [Exophiala xenobiotica]KAK5306450.1 hypothetical protein LTR99_002141 [Exophiala xenobiotica]KAK5553198.1 hypothetical protein LTR46_008911 [Exophiala xenobiotica]